MEVFGVFGEFGAEGGPSSSRFVGSGRGGGVVVAGGAAFRVSIAAGCGRGDGGVVVICHYRQGFMSEAVEVVLGDDLTAHSTKLTDYALQMRKGDRNAMDEQEVGKDGAPAGIAAVVCV